MLKFQFKKRMDIEKNSYESVIAYESVNDKSPYQITVYLKIWRG